MAELNYDEIMRLYRLEKGATKPIELDENFYDALAKLMENEKALYLKSLKEFSVSKARNFTNLKKIVEEFFDMREKKILNKALLALHSSEINEENLTSQERKTMRALLEILQAHHSLLDGMFTEGNEKNEGAEKQKEGIEKGGSGSERSDFNMISLTILSDVQPFIGADMKEYGPYAVGQTAELPHKVASLLVSRKLAKTNE